MEEMDRVHPDLLSDTLETPFISKSYTAPTNSSTDKKTASTVVGFS